MLLPTNDKRRKQEKRQRGTTQEQPETRGMMTHDTLLVGYSLWYEGAGRDRSIYICAHMMTVQHKQVLPRTDYHRYSRSFGVMAHKKREGICPWHKICRLRVSTVSKQAHQDKLIDVPPISPLHCLFDVQRRPVHIGNTAGHDLDTKYDSILVYIEISIDHDPYREQYRSLI